MCNPVAVSTEISLRGPDNSADEQAGEHDLLYAGPRFTDRALRIRPSTPSWYDVTTSSGNSGMR